MRSSFGARKYAQTMKTKLVTKMATAADNHRTMERRHLGKLFFFVGAEASSNELDSSVAVGLRSSVGGCEVVTVAMAKYHN